jgi:hypothetical protein
LFERVEQLKREYTDKYVVVTASMPELARFEGHTGVVKTVNMSGRALVQFDAWNNIGWYDIDIDFLKVVPKPEPGAETAKKHDSAAKTERKAAVNAKADVVGEKKLSPLEMARMQGAAKKPGAAPAAGAPAKMSTADILAAARAKAAGGAAPAAAPKAPAAKPAAGGDGKKMSTADILAAARAKKAAEAEPDDIVEESTEAAPVVAPKAAAKPAAAAGGAKPTTTAEKIAWCRVHDAH